MKMKMVERRRKGGETHGRFYLQAVPNHQLKQDSASRFEDNIAAEKLLLKTQ